MATNAKDDKVDDDDLDVSEQGLAKLKTESEGVETPDEGEDEPEEPDDDDESEEDAGDDDSKPVGDSEEEEPEDDESDDEESSFTKEFPNIKGDTPEEYAKNLETAYKNSTAEALRLKGVAEAPSTTPPATPEAPAEGDKPKAPVTEIDTLSLYAKQQLDKEIATAYTAFQEDYPQVTEPEKYKEFTNEVRIMSETILKSQKRLASPDELYKKAAISLGWEKQSAPDDKEKLGMALKNKGAASKASASSKGKPPTPKISQKMLEMNRKMYPGKTDAEIVKELTPFV